MVTVVMDPVVLTSMQGPMAQIAVIISPLVSTMMVVTPVTGLFGYESDDLYCFDITGLSLAKTSVT